MSSVKRYDVRGYESAIVESPSGRWVLYEDHAAALAAERAKFAAFVDENGEPLTVLMKGKLGQWPTDEMLGKKIPNGTMVYWVIPATSALAAAKEKR